MLHVAFLLSIFQQSSIFLLIVSSVLCYIIDTGHSSSSLASVPLISTAMAGLPTPAATLPLTPATLPESRREPLGVIVSPSLPLVPGKVIDKIKQGLYVDLRELMPDNAALSKMLSEVGAVSVVQAGSKVREIKDPLTWAFYFLALLAMSVEDPKAKEMAAYAQLIIHLSQRHGGRGWLAYDRLFRQQATTGCSHPWNQLAPSLLATTIMTPGPTRRSCELCNGADHTTTQCALFHASSISKSLPTGTPDTLTKRMTFN